MCILEIKILAITIMKLKLSSSSSSSSRQTTCSEQIPLSFWIDCLNSFIIFSLVGGFNPLKNDGVRQLGLYDSPTKRRKMFQTTNQCIYIYIYVYIYIYLYKYKYIIIPPLNPILTICNHINHSTSSWRPTSPAQRL